jgi:hypothetical protein
MHTQFTYRDEFKDFSEPSFNEDLKDIHKIGTFVETSQFTFLPVVNISRVY